MEGPAPRAPLPTSRSPLAARCRVRGPCRGHGWQLGSTGRRGPRSHLHTTLHPSHRGRGWSGVGVGAARVDRCVRRAVLPLPLPSRSSSGGASRSFRTASAAERLEKWLPSGQIRQKTAKAALAAWRRAASWPVPSRVVQLMAAGPGRTWLCPYGDVPVRLPPADRGAHRPAMTWVQASHGLLDDTHFSCNTTLRF